LLLGGQASARRVNNGSPGPEEPAERRKPKRSSGLRHPWPPRRAPEPFREGDAERKRRLQVDNHFKPERSPGSAAARTLV